MFAVLCNRVTYFHLFLAVIVLFSTQFLTLSDASASMSIDLGTEFMKISVVLPGKPMEIALNEESGRKTSTAIGFKNGERVFGSIALALALRNPQWVYHSLPSIIGKLPEHPSVKLFQERYPYHNLSYDNSTGQLVFIHDGEVLYSVDELVAMILEHARNLARQYTNTPITACVLTVPSFYGQAERRRIKRAAEIAGLEVLQLINDNTAVALNFGVFRHKEFTETPKYFLFYDVGSMNTVATLAAYSVVKNKDTYSVEDRPLMKILRVSSDPTLGTSAFAYCLRDEFAKKFNEIKKIAKGDVTKNARSMSKLLHEASNVLVRLSANTEMFAQIENLLEGEDFKLKVTRAEFEKWCSDLFERIRFPFNDALANFSLESTSIEHVVLMGGGTRIPKIQSILLELSKKSELHKGINGDEAAALGAVYQAAFYTPGFRVIPFTLKSYNSYPIGVDFMRAPSLPNEEQESSANLSPYIRQVLFPRGSTFPQKRAIKFNRHVTDLDFYVNYVNLSDNETSLVGIISNLTHVVTKNVSKTIEENQNAEPRGIKAHFAIDSSGLLTLTGIECIFQSKPVSVNEPADPVKEKSAFEKFGSTISGFFGVGKEDSDSSNTNTTNSDAKNISNSTNSNLDHNNLTVNSSQSTSVPNDTETKISVTPKQPSSYSVPIEFEYIHVDLPEIDEINTEASRHKLRKLNKADMARIRLQNSINELETLLIDTKEKVDGCYKKYATDLELAQISGAVLSSSEWYYTRDSNTKQEDYDQRLFELKTLTHPVENRLNEAKKRPDTLARLNATIDNFELLMKQATEISNLFAETFQPKTSESSSSTNASQGNEKPDPEKDQQKVDSKTQLPSKNLFTDEELEAARTAISQTKVWLAKSVELLNTYHLSDDPPISLANILLKEDELKKRFDQMTTKVQYWRSEIARLLAERAKMDLKNRTDPKDNKTAETETKNQTTEVPKSEPTKEKTTESVEKEDQQSSGKMEKPPSEPREEL